MKDWYTDDEKAEMARQERWTRIDMWALACAKAALVLAALRYVFSGS